MERMVQTAVSILRWHATAVNPEGMRFRSAQGSIEGASGIDAGLATRSINVPSGAYGNGPAPKIQALEVVRSVILAAMSSAKVAQYKPEQLKDVVIKAIENVQTGCGSAKRRCYKCSSNKSREVFKNALTGLFCK